MQQTIEIYDDNNKAVCTRTIRNCPSDEQAAEELAHKKLIKYCKSINDNPKFYTWDWFVK